MAHIDIAQEVEARGATFPLRGQVAEGFEGVAEAFATNFREEEELGAGCSVVVDGQTVVDLWGGWHARITPPNGTSIPPSA